MGAATGGTEKVVYLLKDGRTHLLEGDSARLGLQGAVMPALLADGWRIRSIHMTASAAVNADQVLGIAVLVHLPDDTASPSGRTGPAPGNF